MQFQKQQGPECQLAVLAMLTDYPLERLRMRFKQLAAGESIKSVGESTPGSLKSLMFWPVIDFMARELGLKGELPRFGKTINSEWHECTVADLTKEGLKGKGQLALQLQGECKPGHAVAYQDGVIYDPDCPHGPLELDVWRSTRPELSLQAKVKIMRVDSKEVVQ